MDGYKTPCLFLNGFERFCIYSAFNNWISILVACTSPGKYPMCNFTFIQSSFVRLCPHIDRLVSGIAKQLRSMWTPCHGSHIQIGGIHNTFFQYSNTFPCISIPNLDGFISGPAGQESQLGIPRDGIHQIGMSFQCLNTFPRLRIPDLDCVIIGSASQ